jgi:hypothetical protein
VETEKRGDALRTTLVLKIGSNNLLLRQLKNNQNQANTTGAQNFKELNNQYGGLYIIKKVGVKILTIIVLYRLS